MNLRTTMRLRRQAVLLLMSAMLLSCNFLFGQQTEPASAPQPTQHQEKPTTASTTAATDAALATAGPLAVSDSYPFEVTKGVLGYSLAASPGKVWVGTGRGTVEMVDGRTRAIPRSIPLQTGGALGNFVTQMAFDGKYVVAFELIANQGEQPGSHVFAIDAETGEVARHWDLQSSEWTTQESDFAAEAFGVSPRKIWVDGRVIDTQTFEVTQDVEMPPYTRFAYNGSGWMWMTGDTGGACDDLVFAKVDDPTEQMCEGEWPFLPDAGTTGGEVTPVLSTMTLAGDTMWMLGGEPAGENQPFTINAYPADMDALMKQTKPLATVPLMAADSSDIRMVYAGNYLWLTWETGERRGWLYKLDPHTGQTIQSLDLVGDEGRSKGEVSIDIATEGNNLWVLTLFRLIRIKLR